MERLKEVKHLSHRYLWDIQHSMLSVHKHMHTYADIFTFVITNVPQHPLWFPVLWRFVGHQKSLVWNTVSPLCFASLDYFLQDILCLNIVYCFIVVPSCFKYPKTSKWHNKHVYDVTIFLTNPDVTSRIANGRNVPFSIQCFILS